MLRAGNGRKQKRGRMLAFAAEHPGMSQRAIANEQGISPATVNKWLKAARMGDGGHFIDVDERPKGGGGAERSLVSL